MWLRRKPDTTEVRPEPSVTLPLVEPEDWTSDDARSLHSYLSAGTGKKLKDHMLYSLHRQAMRTERVDDFMQGEEVGARKWVALVLQLATASEFIDDEETDSNS
ncbi:MAG: hypothetical protein KJ899_15480 [Gammaproteobacteria bacterium]|nr:hypothetical protein [Gammaproteobacteria bacterium]